MPFRIDSLLASNPIKVYIHSTTALIATNNLQQSSIFFMGSLSQEYLKQYIASLISTVVAARNQGFPTSVKPVSIRVKTIPVSPANHWIMYFSHCMHTFVISNAFMKRMQHQLGKLMFHTSVMFHFSKPTCKYFK